MGFWATDNTVSWSGSAQLGKSYQLYTWISVPSYTHAMHRCSIMPTLWDPMDCSPPGFSVPGISQQEYWSRVPFPSPEDLPDPGIESRSPELQPGFLPSKPLVLYVCLIIIYVQNSKWMCYLSKLFSHVKECFIFERVLPWSNSFALQNSSYSF